MPFNNGTFIKIPVVKDTEITADGLNTVTEDIAAGLNQTFLRDGSVALTGDIKAGNHKLTDLKVGTADTDAATIGQLNTVQGNAVLLTGDQTVAGIKTFTSSPVVPTVLANDSSTKVATTAWVNTIGNNVVHKTGDEIISGYKTFSNITLMNGIRQYSNNITKGIAPSSTQYINMYMTDSSQASGDANAMGLFRTIVNPENTVYSQLQAFKNEAGSQAMGHLRITYDTTNNTYFASIGGSTSGTNLSLTRETNSTTIQTIPTMGWVNNPATSTNIVHRSGNETIGGSKTFNSIVKAVEYLTYKTTLTKGTAPSTVQYINHYLAGDSQEAGDVNALGLFRTMVGTDNYVQTVMHAYKNVASSTASVLLRVYYNTNSNKFGAEVRSYNTGTDTNESLSAVTNSISSTIIPTMGWVNNPAASTNVVHRSDSETITGAKTFTQGKSGWVQVKTTSIAYTETPSSTVGNVYGGFAFLDKDGTKISDIYTAYYTGGGGFSGISLVNHTQANENIGLYFDANGNFYTRAPASDKAESIVTTISCRKKTSSNDDGFGYFELGNGLIIQWGRLKFKSSTLKITFPIKFGNTNYSFVAIATDNKNSGYSYDAVNGVTSRTSTSITIYSYYGSQNIDWIAIGYKS